MIDHDALMQMAKARWPQISERTRIITTPANNVVIPVLEERPLYFDVWHEPEIIGRRPRSGLRGRLWRWIGRLFDNRTWFNRGWLPIYEPEAPFGRVTIQLDRWQYSDGTSGRMGYDPELDILAIGKEAIHDPS